MRPCLSVVVAALLCGAATASGSAVAAGGDASFALKPITYDPALTATKSYFILVAKPGAVIRDRIRLVNTGGRTGTAFLYPVDATTGQTSGAVYLSRQSPRQDVGAWITLGRSRITLAPGADVVVPFTIHVPRAARAGDHLGGIVAENSALTQSRSGGALRIRIKHLTIDAVELQLPGRVVARADVTGVRPGGEHGYQYVYLHLSNPGTIMIKPAGSLVITNAEGRTVARRSLLLDTFLPGTTIDYPALLPKQALSPGSYSATVELHSGNESVIGYRQGQGAPFAVTHTFPFTVSASEQTKVYSATAPLAPPPSARSAGGSKRRLFEIGLIALAALLALALVIGFALRRRAASRRGAPVVPAGTRLTDAAIALPVVPVVTRVEEEEEPGWAGLLAAYESAPRQGERWEQGATAAEVVAASPAEAIALPETPSADEIELERLQQLIVRHDLAQADAYFCPEPVHAEPEAAPAEPAPRSMAARSRIDGDVNGLSSALLEATLVALAALVAARLLKGAD